MQLYTQNINICQKIINMRKLLIYAKYAKILNHILNNFCMKRKHL